MHPSWISICPRFHQHESSPICLQLLACFQMPWRSKLPLLRLFVLLTSVERCKVLSESCQSRLAVQNDRVKSQMVRPTEILDRIIFIGPPTHQIYRIYQSIAKQCNTTLFHLVSSRFIPFHSVSSSRLSCKIQRQVTVPWPLWCLLAPLGWPVPKHAKTFKTSKTSKTMILVG